MSDTLHDIPMIFQSSGPYVNGWHGQNYPEPTGLFKKTLFSEELDTTADDFEEVKEKVLQELLLNFDDGLPYGYYVSSKKADVAKLVSFPEGKNDGGKDVMVVAAYALPVGVTEDQYVKSVWKDNSPPQIIWEKPTEPNQESK